MCNLENVILKLQTFEIPVSNSSFHYDRVQINLTEIAQTPILNNQSYFKIYELSYPDNASQWYSIIENTDSPPISAHLLRNDFTLDITVIGLILIWDILGNSSIIDTLVLEFSGPLTHVTIEEEISEYMIHIECYANHSFENYTFQLDLSFIEYPIKNVSLLDFLKHDITYKFEIEIEENFLFLRNLNIISGIKTNYYLRVNIYFPEVEILESFEEFYSYDEDIVGKWRIISPSNFTFLVHYSVLGLMRSRCKETSLSTYSNNTHIVEARIPNLKWNYTVIVEIDVFFNRGATTSCPKQKYTIVDDQPSNTSYFTVVKNSFIDLHLFPYEPELSSGVKSVIIMSGDFEENISKNSSNHYYIQLSKQKIIMENVSVVITDRAGNIEVLNIDLLNEIAYNNEKIPFESFLPTLISSILLSLYFITKYFKKRRNVLL